MTIVFSVCKQNQYEIKSATSRRDRPKSSCSTFWILQSLISKSFTLIPGGQLLIRIRSMQTSAPRLVQMNQRDFHAPRLWNLAHPSRQPHADSVSIEPSFGWIREESASSRNRSGSLGATARSCSGEAEKEARQTNLQSLRWTMAADYRLAWRVLLVYQQWAALLHHNSKKIKIKTQQGHRGLFSASFPLTERSSLLQLGGGRWRVAETVPGAPPRWRRRRRWWEVRRLGNTYERLDWPGGGWNLRRIYWFN